MFGGAHLLAPISVWSFPASAAIAQHFFYCLIFEILYRLLKSSLCFYGVFGSCEMGFTLVLSHCRFLVSSWATCFIQVFQSANCLTPSPHCSRVPRPICHWQPPPLPTGLRLIQMPLSVHLLCQSAWGSSSKILRGKFSLRL